MPPSDGHTPGEHRAILQGIARRAMLEAGLLVDFPAHALSELGRMSAVPSATDGIRDLRSLPWCSIDNDDSKDLDQLTVAGSLSGGDVKVLVAVADVDSLVRGGSVIDRHARQNSTSVYTPAQVFPMLPERLSTDLTSLNPWVDRLAIVVDMAVGPDGSVQGSDVYRALVHNQAQLAYNAVGAWLEGRGTQPAAIAPVRGLSENLRVQDGAAQRLKVKRFVQGALGLETLEARTLFSDGRVSGLLAQEKNRAREIIEEFMIAANMAVARYLAAKRIPSMRRVVRTPKKWDRIRELAQEAGSSLPENPSPVALSRFLEVERAKNPIGYPDLCSSVIKLLGSGEYVVQQPGAAPIGHFGLAVRDYVHSTAPNRRYPDLVTQRMLKAAIAGRPQPLSADDLWLVARHCTEAEDLVKKVERRVQKSAAAILMESRIGERFDGIVTGAADKGTWVRLFAVPVEGRLVRGAKGVDVGHRVKVVLLHTDVERGYIDFGRA